MSYNQRKKGRRKNVPNMQRIGDDLLKNQHGVVFTEAEKKALVSAVNSANRKRREMLKMEGRLPRMDLGKDTGDTIASRQRMGQESDFIIQPKTKSLQRFKTKEDYDRYMTNLQRVNKRDYISERVKLYKRNHIKAIERELGKEEPKDIVMKIRMMKQKDYMEKVASEEEALEIGFVYSHDDRASKREQMRQALGMKSKEEFLPTESM